MMKNYFQSDERGTFQKITNLNNFFKHNDLRKFEVFWTNSSYGTIRGLHYQLEPFSQNKIINCIEGEIFDVAVDLRTGKDFGKIYEFRLSQSTNNSIFIPKGFAHGFQSLSQSATVLYLTDNVYAPNHDRGYLWNSVPIKWPLNPTHISARDSNFPEFDPDQK